MKTIPDALLALVLAASIAACSSEDHTSLRSAGKGKQNHADAVPNTGGDGSTPAAQDPTGHPTLPPDSAHTPSTGDESQTGNASGSGSGDGTDPGAGSPMVEEPMSQRPAVGIRNFRQINDTMAALTGVPRTTTAVATAYATLETQLPDNNDIRTFAGSHQVAISKLAVEYCDAMVESPTLSVAAIPGFNFAALPAAAFNAAGKDLVAKSLLAKFWGTGLESNPNEAETLTMLAALIDDTVAGKAATAQITKNVVKGICTALLSTGQVLFL